MKGLKKKFNPEDKITTVELSARLRSIKMKDQDEPKVLSNALAEVNIVFEFGLTEERKISEIMAKSPKSCTQTLASEETLFEKL